MNRRIVIVNHQPLPLAREIDGGVGRKWFQVSGLKFQVQTFNVERVTNDRIFLTNAYTLPIAPEIVAVCVGRLYRGFKFQHTSSTFDEWS